MERLATFFAENQPKRILDVGTGAGNFIALIKQLYSDYEEIVGIDTLDYAIKSASKNFVEDEKVRFEKMDALQMSYPDNRFDVVCLSNSLHHLTLLKQTLQEMIRVTKPGGYILISEMISNDLDERQHAHLLMHHFAAKIDRYLGDTHNDTYSDETIISLLKEHGNIPIEGSWTLTYERRQDNTDEEIEWLKSTLDRVLNRVTDPIKRKEFSDEAETIKAYIDQHGFDSATTVIVVMKK